MRLLLLLPAVALLQAQPIPDPAEQRAILERATKEARRYDAQIPNFISVDTILREEGSIGPPERWKSRDKLEEQVAYEKGRPVVTVLTIDGKPTRKRADQVGGLRPDGIVGAGIVPNHVFNPILGPQFTWKGWEAVDGRRVQAFTFDVAPFLQIDAAGKDAVVGFRGSSTSILKRLGW